MEIGVGIIGCGSITRTRHAPEYYANPNCKLIGFFDPVLSRAEELAQKYNAKVYHSYEDMVSDNCIDAISVCSSNETHASITVAALKAGKHVLCEKPMATNLDEARGMIDAALENKRHLMIDHSQRLIPAHIKAKEILDSGEMGRIITFRTCFKHAGPEFWSVDKSKNTWFFNKKAASFGALGDLGIHKSDLIMWLTGQEVSDVFALVDTIDKRDDAGKPIGVEDNAVCIFKMSGGIEGTMEVSWCCYGNEDNSTIIYCDRGVMKIFADAAFDIVLEMKDGSSVQYKLGGISTNTRQLNSGVIDAFIDGLIHDKAPLIPGEEGYKALSVVSACVESSKSERWAKVKKYEKMQRRG